MTDRAAPLALALAIVLPSAADALAAGSAAVRAAAAVPRPARRGATPSTAGPRATDEVLAVTGFDRQIPVFGAQLAERLAEVPVALSAADRDTVRRLLRGSLDGEHLRRAVALELARQPHPPGAIEAIAAWYRGSVGVRVTAASALLATREGQQQFAAFVAQQQRAPLPPSRAVLIEQLEWLEGGADTVADIVLGAMRAWTLTLNAAMPPERRQRPGLLARQLDEARPRLVMSLREPTLRSLQFVYRELSEDELRHSVEFHSSEAARWFGAALKQAFTRATREAAERSARELVRAIPPDRWRAPAAPSEVR